MGLFSNPKQEELNKLAFAVYNDMDHFTQLLTNTGGAITSQARISGEKVESSILRLYETAVKYQSSHKYVSWAGQMTEVTQLIPMLVLVLEDEIEKHTTFRFTKLNGVLR
jgi:hypothetical protein